MRSRCTIIIAQGMEGADDSTTDADVAREGACTQDACEYSSSLATARAFPGWVAADWGCTLPRCARRRCRFCPLGSPRLR